MQHEPCVAGPSLTFCLCLLRLLALLACLLLPDFGLQALRIMLEVCRDGQLLVDLFVNYDCDLESSNLFERMVAVLVKVSSFFCDKVTPEQQTRGGTRTGASNLPGFFWPSTTTVTSSPATCLSAWWRCWSM